MPAVTPQDHKKPASETSTEVFPWEHDGKTFTLPPASKIKAGVFRQAVKQASEVEQIFYVIENIVDTDTLAIIDDMSIDEVGEMFQAWQAAAGASLGE